MPGIRSAKRFIAAFLVLAGSFIGYATTHADEKVRLAYISDSPGSSSPFWIAKEAGLFKKQGLDAELIFINGSTRGVQSLIAGEIDFAGAVGTSAINGKLAGGDIVIVNSMVNTLPYYIIGKPDIGSPEEMKGRAAATHIPGTSADFALRPSAAKIRHRLQPNQGGHGGRHDRACRCSHQRPAGFHHGHGAGKNCG